MTSINLADALFRRSIPGTLTTAPIDLQKCFASLTGTETVLIDVIAQFHIKPTDAAGGDRGTADYRIWTETVALSVESITSSDTGGEVIIVGTAYESDEDFSTTSRYEFRQGLPASNPATYVQLSCEQERHDAER